MPAAKTTTARKRPTAKTTPRRPSAAKAKPAPAPETRADVVRRQVERVLAVQVGAVLEARDAVTETVEDLQSRFGSSAAAEKQLKTFERRGTTARKRVEREAKKTRRRVERELKTRRNRVEKTVRTERKRVENEARTAVKDANKRVETVVESIRQIDLANAADLQGRVGQVVQSGVEFGTEAVRRAGERIAA